MGLICGVLFALAVYMLSAWLLEEPLPLARAPIACKWDWRTLGCPNGCKMLLPGACKRVWLQDAPPRGMQARVKLASVSVSTGEDRACGALGAVQGSKFSHAGSRRRRVIEALSV